MAAAQGVNGGAIIDCSTNFLRGLQVILRRLPLAFVEGTLQDTLFASDAIHMIPGSPSILGWRRSCATSGLTGCLCWRAIRSPCSAATAWSSIMKER